MGDFLQPRRFESISRLEIAGLCMGIGSLVTAWPLNSIGWASNTATSLGFAVLGLALGSIFKDWRWRKVFSQTSLDPNARVYTDRGDYGRIVEHIDSAEYVDFMGISLAYSLEFIRDNSSVYFSGVRHTRILLPAHKEICDGRDHAQGSPLGSLWRQLLDLRSITDKLARDFPQRIEFRYFGVQPYQAMTRVDDRLWVSPYITKSGNSSPVLVVYQKRSPELYAKLLEHFDNIWARSLQFFDPGN